MKKRALSLMLLATLGLVIVISTPPEAAATVFVCPMPEHAGEFDKPGRCPECRMNLIAKNSQKKAAILVFPGVQIIDYAGPYEVFGQANFEVFTVAENPAPLMTAMGMTMTPKYTLANSPVADVLIIPGGTVEGPVASAATIGWIQKNAGSATHVLSVCNGAFILQKTGLLDGLSATTFYGLIDRLRQTAPKTRVVSDQRFVDNGKFITTAGLSSGIDGSLHVIERMRGKGAAQAIALHMEYDWKPGSTYARAALADRKIPSLDLPDGSTWKVISTTGDRNRWELKGEITAPLATSALKEFVLNELARARWVRLKETTPEGTSRWRFKDSDGKPWNGTVILESVPGADGKLISTARIERSKA